MTSEVRKVLNSCVISSKVRDRLDAAERADAAKREVSFVVECKRCGQSTCTSPEYSAVCGCGAVFKLHRHNQQADAAKHEESVQGLRQKVAELVARYSRYTLPYSAIMVRYIIADLNAIIATKPESQPATASGPSVTFGALPKLTLQELIEKAAKEADQWRGIKPVIEPAVAEKIRAIAAQAVRDAMPDVLDALAETWDECGHVGGGTLREHADKLRKERGA